MKYDVIIVGAGPAGIFSALELTEKNNLKVLMLDRGQDINQRKCPANRGFECVNCDPCTVLSGWGGAGAFSDGKLTLSTEVGGWLNQYVSNNELEELIKYSDGIYLKFGATQHTYGAEDERTDEIERKASLAGLKLIRQRIRHMGTERCAETLRKMRQELNGKVDFKPKSDVKGLIVKNNVIEGVETVDGEKILGKYVIVAQAEAALNGFKQKPKPWV